ncbi:MAG: hypothetical protein AB7F32_02735 [Victivallaceae bacterium]
MNLETLVRAYGEITPGDSGTLDAILDRLPSGIFPESLRQSLAAHCAERKLAPAAFVRSVLKTRILAGLGVTAPPAGEKRINRHQCFGCALKHLASALVIAGEIQTGYDTPEYALYLLGNLAEAQEQIACRTPALANRIRKLRLAIFGDGGTPELTAEALKSLLELAVDVGRLADDRDAPAAVRRRCGCEKTSAPVR